MATRVEHSIDVDVPVSTAYNQWTQFEDFPHFMSGVSEVRQLDDTTLHWVAEIGGVKREWRANLLEQLPDEKIASAATEGATNAGAVRFAPAGADRTRVTLALEYDPEGIGEQVGDKLGFVERRVKGDLEKFKSLIEDAGYASGAWRGHVPGAAGTPGVEAAASSQGDSGKAGISAKTAVAGAAAAAAGLAGAAAAAKKRSDSDDETTEDVGVAVAGAPPTGAVDTGAPVPPLAPETPATSPGAVESDPDRSV